MPEQVSADKDFVKDGVEVLKGMKEKKSNAKEVIDFTSELFGQHKDISDERIEKGLLPFATKDLPGLEPGSKKHIMQNLMGTTGSHEGKNFWGNKVEKEGSLTSAGKTFSFGKDLVGASYKGYKEEGVTGAGRESSKELAGKFVPEDDLLKASSPTLSTTAGAAKAISAVAKLTGHEEAGQIVDSAASPLSATSTVVKEGAGSWYDIFDAFAAKAAGDEDWVKILEKHNEKGVTTESWLQPLYWGGQVLEGKGGELADRLIGEEGRSGKMGRFVEAGNYWGDVMAEPGKFTRDMKEMGNFMWEGVSGKGGIKGAAGQAWDATKEAGSYWGDVLTGEGHFMQDMGDIKDYLSEHVTLDNVLEGANTVAQGITHAVGGDTLVNMTHEASDYWGNVFSGEGHFGQDMKELGSFMWSGQSGEGGIKSGLSAAGSAIKSGASEAWDWAESGVSSGLSAAGSAIESGASDAWDWATSWF